MARHSISPDHTAMTVEGVKPRFGCSVVVGWWMDGWAWLVALGSWLWVGVGGLVDGWFWMVGCMDVCMDGQTDELVLDWWMDG